MAKIHRVETYLGPKDAARFTGVDAAKLASLARRGVLTHYRTDGNHRRYKLDELKALRKTRAARRVAMPSVHY